MRLDVGLPFEVGTIERYEVSFHWGQTWGVTHVEVDGVEVFHKLRPFDPRSTRRSEVTVGDAEVHAVAFERTRPRVLAGLRTQTVKAFVDGELVAEG